MVRSSGFYATLIATSLVLIVPALNRGSHAQDRPASAKMPSSPAQPYVVTTAQALDGTVTGLHAANKLQDLISAGNIGCRVFVQHEANVATNQGEVHDAADDVFIILDGSAVFVLGGILDAPKETQPGEWRAPGISGGKEVKANKGDVIIVPRGTPHRRVTTGLDVTLMVIKSSAPAKG
jgi:mannose-6-phosphate isomerase-like protein (cupin superfamily)